MICGERGIVAPEPHPASVLLVSPHAGLFARLSDELLMDCLRAFMANGKRTNRSDCHMIDAVRAEFALRHAPADPRDALAEELEYLEPLYVQ